METNVAYLSGIASILAVLLAFYTIFINGRAVRKMLREHGEILREHGEMLREHGEMLMKINETLRYIAELVKTESERLREEIRTQK